MYRTAVIMSMIVCQKEKVTDVEKKFSTCEIKMNEMYRISRDYVNDSLSEMQDNISKMEDRSRRNNMRVRGVTEEKGETWVGRMCK